MKTIGLLGCIDLPSTMHYLKGFDFWKDRLDLDDSPKIAMRSGDYENITSLRRANRWDDIADEAVKGATAVKNAGADFLVMATSLMDKVANRVEEYAKIPVLRITAPTVAAIKSYNIEDGSYEGAVDGDAALLIGTKWTMEESFLIDEFKNNNISVAVPDAKDRDDLEEMRKAPKSLPEQAEFFRIAHRYYRQVVIIGCLNFNPFFNSDTWLIERHTNHLGKTVLFFNMADLHIRAAVKRAAEKSL